MVASFPVHSLRSRLLVLILGPLVLVAAAAGLLHYRHAETLSARLYDKTLLAVAHAIARDVLLTEGDLLAEDLLETLTDALGDQIFYHVRGPARGYVTGYAGPPAVPAGQKAVAGRPLLYDAVYRGETVRVVALRAFVGTEGLGHWIELRVWQTVGRRADLSLDLALQGAALMLVMIGAVGAIVWVGVQRGLRPLRRLRDAISRRSPDDLRPIQRPVPPEVASLVAAMNTLFGQLAQAFADRDAFLSAAAHQLRNPIAGLQAQAEAAERATDPTQLRRRVGDVAEACRRTGRLTRQLLSMERARHGADAATPVILTTLVAEVTAGKAPAALRRGIMVSFDAGSFDAGEQAVTVAGDAVMLSEAVENLLDNAVRHGCRDGGAVAVTLRGGAGTVTIEVADDGPGIPDAERATVLEPFRRGTTAAGDGCGLGLSIVNAIAVRHGGRLAIGTRAGPAPAPAATPAAVRRPGACVQIILPWA